MSQKTEEPNDDAQGEEARKETILRQSLSRMAAYTAPALVATLAGQSIAQAAS